MVGSLMFLATLILTSPAPAGSETPPPEAPPTTTAASAPWMVAPGPIQRAIELDAERFALASASQVIHLYPRQRPRLAPWDWSRVARLQPGTEIELTTVKRHWGRQHLVSVDHADLTVLDTSHPSLTDAARKRLRDLAVINPLMLLRVRMSAPLALDEQTRIGPDGLFDAGRKILEASDIVRTFSRADVLQVSRFERRGSGWGALAGGTVGFLVGTYVGVSLGFKQCGESCSDEGVLMLLSFIGLPVGAGFAGYHIAKREVDVVGFRMHLPPSPGIGVVQNRLFKR